MLASVLQAASPHQACSGIFATFAHDTKFSMLRPASATPWLTYRQTRRSTGPKPHQFFINLRVARGQPLTTRLRRNRLLVALAGLLSAASLVNAFADYEPAQPILVKPTFRGDEACSGPLATCPGPTCPGPFVASRFDPDACDLTSEQQDVYDPAASSFVLTEGVCTNLCKLSVVITDADDRLPNGGNLPQSYKFTCSENCAVNGV